MPIVRVMGIPEDFKERKFLKERLRHIVPEVRELEITPDQVSVFLFTEKEDLGEEIIVFIEGLFVRPRRTQAVIDKLANRVASELRNHVYDQSLPKCKFIEIFVQQFAPDNGGYASMSFQ